MDTHRCIQTMDKLKYTHTQTMDTHPHIWTHLNAHSRTNHGYLQLTQIRGTLKRSHIQIIDTHLNPRSNTQIMETREHTRTHIRTYLVQIMETLKHARTQIWTFWTSTNQGHTQTLTHTSHWLTLKPTLEHTNHGNTWTHTHTHPHIQIMDTLKHARTHRSWTFWTSTNQGHTQNTHTHEPLTHSNRHSHPRIMETHKQTNHVNT